MTLNIYNYSDYRLFLHDWFWSIKKIKPNVSFRYVSRILGLKAPNHFHLVISSKRNLSPATLEKLLRLMELEQMEKQYMKLLFREHVTKSAATKKELAAQIELIRSTPHAKTANENRLQLVGNSLAWYIKMGAVVFEGKPRHTVVKLVLDSCSFPVVESDVTKALDFLVAAKQLEFVDGLSCFEGGDIRTKWDLDRTEIKRHHQSNLALAAESISWPVDQRFHSSVTVPCNEELYQNIIAEIRALCLSILKRSSSPIIAPCKADKVVTLQLALFPYFKF
jgi:uncharacterized protein (TIGR02147 family)